MLPSADTPTTSPAGFTDAIALGATEEEVEGRVIAVRLPADKQGETHYGKIEILELDGPAGERAIRFVWAYQEFPDYIRF